MVKLEVILNKWGNYKKGDTLELHESTAKGCIANKAVKVVDGSVIESKGETELIEVVNEATTLKAKAKKKKAF